MPASAPLARELKEHGLNPRLFPLSGVVLAPLLFLVLTACAAQPQSAGAEYTRAQNNHAASTVPENSAHEKTPAKKSARGTTVGTVLPEDVLD